MARPVKIVYGPRIRTLMILLEIIQADPRIERGAKRNLIRRVTGLVEELTKLTLGLDSDDVMLVTEEG